VQKVPENLILVAQTEKDEKRKRSSSEKGLPRREQLPQEQTAISPFLGPQRTSINLPLMIKDRKPANHRTVLRGEGPEERGKENTAALLQRGTFDWKNSFGKKKELENPGTRKVKREQCWGVEPLLTHSYRTRKESTWNTATPIYKCYVLSG